ncbi:MAG: hypothetical protein Q7S96_04850 [bacterium]|nr:hypothetical protein [bacterium]
MELAKYMTVHSVELGQHRQVVRLEHPELPDTHSMLIHHPAHSHCTLPDHFWVPDRKALVTLSTFVGEAPHQRGAGGRHILGLKSITSIHAVEERAGERWTHKRWTIHVTTLAGQEFPNYTFTLPLTEAEWCSCLDQPPGTYYSVTITAPHQ